MNELDRQRERLMARQRAAERATLEALERHDSTAFRAMQAEQRLLLVEFRQLDRERRLYELAKRGAHRERAGRSVQSIRQRRARERLERRSNRDEIRTNQPNQRRGPPDPEPLISALDDIASALAVLRKELVAAMAGPPADEWISQRASTLPPRTHARLCRRLLAEGDPRAGIRGRDHLLMRSAIDEHLRDGVPRVHPRPLRASTPAPANDALTPGQLLLAELRAEGFSVDAPRRAVDGGAS